MLKRFISVLVVLVLASLLVVPVGAQDESVLRIPMSPDPEHLNPFTATTIAISVVLNNVYDGMVGLEPDTGEVIPRLAESWDVSEDGLTYTFHLRQGVMFHDVPYITYEDGNREFTADDWIAAANYSVVDDETIASHPEWLESVVGYDEKFAGEAETVSGIEKIDDYTIQITLSEANRLFLNNLGVPAIPQEALADIDTVTNQPV